MYTMVHPVNVEKVWHLVAPWIAQAVEASTLPWDLNNIKENAQRGGCSLIVGKKPNSPDIDMVLVAEHHNIGGKPVLVVHWCAGINMDSWISDLPLLEDLAHTMGFSQIQIWGRKGWEKKLRPLGYMHEFTVVSKLLKKEIN